MLPAMQLPAMDARAIGHPFVHSQATEHASCCNGSQRDLTQQLENGAFAKEVSCGDGDAAWVGCMALCGCSLKISCQAVDGSTKSEQQLPGSC